MNSFTLTYPKNRLDLELCVSSGQVFRWEKLEDGSFLGVDGNHWYHMSPPHIKEDLESIEVRSNATLADLESFFRLDWDAEETEKKILEIGPEMEPYMQSLPGLRLVRPSYPTEVFFCFLCTPNNNLKRIIAMSRHLAEYGETMTEVEGRVLKRFPTVDVIAQIPETRLREMKFGYRAATIPGIARQVMARGGEEYLAGLRGLTYTEAFQELCSFKGIGAKLADCIALFALHHTEAVPIDTHIWQASVRLYFPEWKEKSLTDSKYRELGDYYRNRFGMLTGWAHQYLFYDNVLNWRSRKEV